MQQLIPNTESIMVDSVSTDGGREGELKFIGGECLSPRPANEFQ